MADVAERPQGVLLGAGGDPLVLGLPVFAVGSAALGLALIGFVPLAALGFAIPVIALATGFFQIVVTIWAIWLGQSIVAVIFGTFSGFWLSLAALLLGLNHNWYGVPAAAVPITQEAFYIVFAALFFCLLLPCLRLPAAYPLIVLLVVVALVLATIGTATGSSILLLIAGIVVLVFAVLGFYAFIGAANVALGGKPLPLGPPLVK